MSTRPGRGRLGSLPHGTRSVPATKQSQPGSERSNRAASATGITAYHLMPADWIYHTVGVLLVVANVAAWVATFFMLPGTWVIVGLMALAAWFLPEAEGRTLGVSWWEVVILAALAGLGELVEFASGAAGAQKVGASRRSVALSLIGAAVGSIGGAVVGFPVPVVGPIIAAVLGGGAGAFGGAYLGEAWKGRTHGERVAVGQMAFVGRVLGTVGKLGVGLLMVVVAATVFWLS